MELEFDEFTSNTKIYALLELVKNGKSLIRMKLLGTEYEEQTIVEDIRNKENASYLIIECPKGFTDLIAGSSRQIQCEFTGSDKLSYMFNADIAQIYKNNIWALFPNLIRRKQLRRNFRVNAPPGTQMVFKKCGVSLVNQVINLSLGGSFGALISLQNLADMVLPLCTGDNLTDIEVIFRSERSKQRVSIRKARIVRFEENKEAGSHACAIHFVDMDKVEEKALTELIYVIQREYLQKRTCDL
jgi:c-di-GMP-binding flagellar brake protein YcgR